MPGRGGFGSQYANPIAAALALMYALRPAMKPESCALSVASRTKIWPMRGSVGSEPATHETTGAMAPALIMLSRRGVLMSAAEPVQFGSTTTGFPAIAVIAP